MFVTSFRYFLLFVILNKSSCEEFNLYGEAGQAYSLEIEIGHPPQKLNVLIDTGSTTLAIASYPIGNSSIYFNSEKSSSIIIIPKEVRAQYSQGSWIGQLVLDYVKFPSLTSIPEVRCEIALIKVSDKFFMNGSGWQGLLGLAFQPIGAWGDNVVVGSWLDSVEKKFDKAMSFQLKLCGVRSPTNATHYGNLEILDDSVELLQPIMYRTPILQERWYEVGVLSVRVLQVNATKTMDNTTSDSDHYKDVCLSLNKDKSIVDSGSTNIRLPDVVFREVVNELISAAASNNMFISDEFWYHGGVGCWPDPQDWSLPSIAIDLLSTEADNQYFTLEITPQNYIRVITAQNNTVQSGSLPIYCYKLGLEAVPGETILGYTALEGFEVIFNRSAGWIGWRTSNCGPNTRITGPYNYSSSFRTLCQLANKVENTEITIKAAQWFLCGISMIAVGVVIYVLAPVVRRLVSLYRLRLPLQRSQQISLSQAALVEQEN